MYLSDLLRDKVSQIHNVNLTPYVWDDTLEEKLMNIPLSYFESAKELTTLKDVYKLGLNIGYCGLTSRYILTIYPDAVLVKGSCNLLEGTKDYKKHMWVKTGKTFIEPTLKLVIPEEDAKNLGYTEDGTICHESGLILSEYELFSNNLEIYKRNPDLFRKSCLKVVS